MWKAHEAALGTLSVYAIREHSSTLASFHPLVPSAMTWASAPVAALTWGLISAVSLPLGALVAITPQIPDTPEHWVGAGAAN